MRIIVSCSPTSVRYITEMTQQGVCVCVCMCVTCIYCFGKWTTRTHCLQPSNSLATSRECKNTEERKWGGLINGVKLRALCLLQFCCDPPLPQTYHSCLHSMCTFADICCTICKYMSSSSLCLIRGSVWIPGCQTVCGCYRPGGQHRSLRGTWQTCWTPCCISACCLWSKSLFLCNTRRLDIFFDL